MLLEVLVKVLYNNLFAITLAILPNELVAIGLHQPVMLNGPKNFITCYTIKRNGDFGLFKTLILMFLQKFAF